MRKKYQKDVGAGFDSMMFFIAATSVISFFVALLLSDNFCVVSETLFIAVLYASISAAASALCIIGPKYGNLSVVIMFATLGSLVLSAVFGFFVDSFSLKEDFLQIIAFIIVLTIVYLNFISEKKNDVSEKKEKNSRIYNLICVLLFFINGSGAVLLKIKTEYYPKIGNYEFIAQSSLSGFIITLVMFFLFRLMKNNKNEGIVPVKTYFSYKALTPVFIYGAVYFISDFFGLITTAMIPLIVKAGLSFSLPLIMTALFDYIVYRQKPSKNNYIQMLLAFVCCILFSL